MSAEKKQEWVKEKKLEWKEEWVQEWKTEKKQIWVKEKKEFIEEKKIQVWKIEKGKIHNRILMDQPHRNHINYYGTNNLCCLLYYFSKSMGKRKETGVEK